MPPPILKPQRWSSLPSLSRTDSLCRVIGIWCAQGKQVKLKNEDLISQWWQSNSKIRCNKESYLHLSIPLQFQLDDGKSFLCYKYVSICQTSRRQKVIILGNTEIVIIALVERNKSWIVKRIPFYASLSERLKQTVPFSKIQYRENVNSEQTTVQHGRSDHGCQFFLLLASIVVDVDMSSLVRSSLMRVMTRETLERKHWMTVVVINIQLHKCMNIQILIYLECYLKTGGPQLAFECCRWSSCLWDIQDWVFRIWDCYLLGLLATAACNCLFGFIEDL